MKKSNAYRRPWLVRGGNVPARMKRKGGMIVLCVVALIAGMAFVGLAVDIGMINLTKSRMQATADAVALAAVKEIQVALQDIARQGGDANDVDAATAFTVQRSGEIAERIAELNGLHIDPQVDLRFGQRQINPAGGHTVSWGSSPFNVVEATIRKDNTDLSAPDGKLSLFFSPLYGDRTTALKAKATAYIEARDIVAVLDYSGSMCYDSKLNDTAVNNFGLAAVEGGLDDIWYALTDSGAAYSDEPGTEKFPSSGFGKINSYSSGYYASSDTSTIFDYLELGGNGEPYYTAWPTQSGGYYYTTYGGYQWKARATDGKLYRKQGSKWKNKSSFPGDTANVGGSPYVPFPQEGRNSDGTLKGKPNESESEDRWKDYINRVKGGISYGYTKKYNYRTLMAYLIEKRKNNSQSEDLWRAPIYPFHAMKEGMTIFTQFLDALSFGDQLGLTIYAQTARRETGLTNDSDFVEVSLGDQHLTLNYADIDTIQRHKQAGHYDSTTNIGDGIKEARELLDEQGRNGVSPTLLVMTDGNANQYPSSFNGLPSGWDWSELTDYDNDGAANYTISGGSTSDRRSKEWAFYQAKLAIDQGYTIHTMSVGAGADTELMKAIAFAGKGQWINVPGGTSVEDMRDQLETAFMLIAGRVPPGKLMTTDE